MNASADTAPAAADLPTGRREVYVYWKLPAAEAAAAVAAARSMHAELAAHASGLRCRLHRRSDIRDGLVTLMETYEHPGGVTADHQDLIAAAAARHLAAWATAPRHVEVFQRLGG